ncbi:hypothetical protein HMPREF9554_03079 [Treponema phagedenis F0421]|nr:hypothetical protein HMPREF9554_03079 [Treponema phagedenis F0421]
MSLCGFKHSYGKFTRPCEIPNDVLKQSSLQSFKTRGLVFAMDGKNETVALFYIKSIKSESRYQKTVYSM